jgi:hypothetical protein
LEKSMAQLKQAILIEQDKLNNSKWKLFEDLETWNLSNKMILFNNGMYDKQCPVLKTMDTWIYEASQNWEPFDCRIDRFLKMMI